MKKEFVFTALTFLVTPICFAKNLPGTVVDTSEVEKRGLVTIVLSGDENSNAAKLYRSLSKLESIPDSDLGGRHYSETKQGAGVFCQYGTSKTDNYECYVELTTAGDSKKFDRQ